MDVRGVVSLLLGSLLLVISACSGGEPREVTDDEGVAISTQSSPSCDADNGGLVLPDGFCALVVADGLGSARHLDVTADGDIYVRMRGNRGRGPEDPPGQGITALRDTTGDGRADVIETFSDHYGTGLELRDNYLYVSTTTEVYRYPLHPEELIPTSDAELVISEFPEQRGHSSKGFAFDGDGHIYVNVGAPSNACMELARTKGSLGMRPCPQLERQASIWRFELETLGQTQEADGYKFVTGTRNIVGLAWDAQTNAMYAVQHGRDSLHTLWDFSQEDSAEIPSEELFRLEDGNNFGWPYCYHDKFQNKRLLSPEYGGDGQLVGECGEYEPPLVAFPGHWAPNDMHFYGGNQFPAEFRDGAFVVFHGSWNRAPLQQGGYQVAFAPRRDGEFTGDYETFAGGFAGEDTPMQPQNAAHRPVGIAEGVDGSLYVSDDANGTIWRIVYRGP